MARTPRLRHEDPRCGREHFDKRAGIEWESGPDPNDIAYSKPDVPWNKKAGSKLLFDYGQWVVTDFGLEPLASVRDRYETREGFRIPAGQLLIMHVRGPVYAWPIQLANEPWVDFDAFEQAFRKAVEFYFPPRKLAPRTLEQARTRYGQPPVIEPSLVDTEVLERTLRRAHRIAQKRARNKR